MLAYLTFDSRLGAKLSGSERFFHRMGVDFRECLDDPRTLNTLRKIFERKIRYWDCRPMTRDPFEVVSPADSKVVVGSFEETSALFLKGKFFDLKELLGEEKPWWRDFEGGDFAVCRITPDKYHYNHTPVAGRILDIYQLPGPHHSCNPMAVVLVATPYYKNQRVVTILETDDSYGTRVGRVAMIEVVALMIGKVTQCYSSQAYERPRAVDWGMFLEKGKPKSLYRPGSSTTILLFQKGRIRFEEDLLENQARSNASNRFSVGFGQPLVETEVKVRSDIARSATAPRQHFREGLIWTS